MKQLTLLLLFITAACTVRSQNGDTLKSDTLAVLAGPPNFQAQALGNFFVWANRPDSIDFMLFNRWGETVAKSSKPDFKIEDALVIPKSKLREYDTYVYRLRVYYKGKPMREIRATVVYRGFYCGG